MLALLVAATFSPAHADFEASRCTLRAPVGVTLTVAEPWQFCAGFTSTVDNRVVQQVTGDDGSGTYVASADGRTVVFVADYATTTFHGDWKENDYRTGEPAVGVRVYRDGKMLGSHTIRSLVKDGETRSSISHLHWVEPATFEGEVGDVWTLTVFGGRTLSFDTRTGDRLP
jgi:hypothetical protein